MYLSLLLSALLAQADAGAEPDVPPAAASEAQLESQLATQRAAERAAAAAATAAAAALRAADAASRIADVVVPPPPPERVPHWVGNIGVGLTFLYGNSEALTLTGAAAADRKWEDWAVALRLIGAYGLTNPDTNVAGSTTAVTARRALGSVRADRDLGETLASIFLLVGSEFDHLKNIESRTIGEGGLALTLLDVKKGKVQKLWLRLDLAARAGYETRFQYFPRPSKVVDSDIVVLGPRVAVHFRWNFSDDVRLTEELEANTSVVNPTFGRTLLTNSTKLSARLTSYLALTTAVLVSFDSQPPRTAAGARRKQTDVSLTVGVEASF